MKDYAVIIRKATNTQDKETIYLTTIVRVNDDNSVNISKASWLNEVMLKALKYTPLNYSIEKGKIKDNKGAFDRFNKGANMIVLRKVTYPKFNTFIILQINKNGLVSREIKEDALVKQGMKIGKPIIQNAIIRGNAVCAYESSPFDTIKGIINNTKTPNTKPVNKQAILAKVLTKSIPDSPSEYVEKTIIENNNDLLIAMIETKKRTKYNVDSICKGKEKPFNEEDAYADFCFEYILGQVCLYINKSGIDANRKKQVEHARKYFSKLKDKDKRELALNVLVLK